ncbi:MAG: hypothetical protein AB8B80_16385 [Marinicellaceae bacterium]
MKYSIIISPLDKNSNAIIHAIGFIQALLKLKQVQISVFFYGHAVQSAFEFDPEWLKISQKNVSLIACSTIAEEYLQKNIQPNKYVSILGLGQWMESVHDANKSIEFS